MWPEGGDGRIVIENECRRLLPFSTVANMAIAARDELKHIADTLVDQGCLLLGGSLIVAAGVGMGLIALAFSLG
jgi:hypothetical protein